MEILNEEVDDDVTAKRFKRFRSNRMNTNQKLMRERSQLKEMIFLRDLHFGFLPDDCEVEFVECFNKLAYDYKFAAKCFRLALLSRNEDLVRVLLDHLIVTKENFHEINDKFLDSLLLLEAVELDDLESIQSVLAWRDAKGSNLGLTDVDKKLLKLQKSAQEVIVSAAIKNNYKVIKILYADGYKIIDNTMPMEKRRFYFRDTSTLLSDDMMESHIEKIRKFKAMASPAYMAMTYVKDPVEHAFDFTKKAWAGMRREPEFRSEYENVRSKCSEFAVSILNSCYNSAEVEQVLNGTGIGRPYARLYRALNEDQKEFVSHPYCQVLLHSKWLNGMHWNSYYSIVKILHVILLILASPILCVAYLLTPLRDHSNIKGPVGWLMRHMDRPVNRYILHMTSYSIFLYFLLLSVIRGIGDHKNKQRTWYFNMTALWVLCYSAKLMSESIQICIGRIAINKFRFFFDLLTNVMFLIAIGFKIYGYEVSLNVTGGLLLDRTEILDVYHPINIGANIYGAAACMAFLKVIFLFEIHYRFGPILFCIKNVFWDILSIVLSFVITVFAFAVGLVSVFGIFEDNATKFSDFESAFKTLFWIIFDPGKEEYADINQADDSKDDDCCCNESNDSQGDGGISLARPIVRPNRPSNPFATIRPETDEGDQLSHGFGLYIWAFYQVFVVLIMLNLLISLMTTTFAKIQRNADSEWKFSRASIWIHYYDEFNSIPPPFNLIPSVYSMIQVFAWCSRGTFGNSKMWNASLLMSQESKRKLYDTLIERVFRSEEKKMDSRIGRSDIENLEKEIAIDIADLRRDIRNFRRDMGLTVPKYYNPKDGYPFKKMRETLRAHPSIPDANPTMLKPPKENEKEENKSNVIFNLQDGPKSFKVDNSPEVVSHLVQTLGLIGVSSTSLDTLPTKQNTLDRHNSLA